MSAQSSAINGGAKSSASAASRQQLKTNSAGKSLDGARKQAASPVDAASRKSPAPKAWSSGTNPITQRPNAPTPTPVANGLPNGASKNAQSKPQQPASSEGAVSNRHATDRLLYLLVNYTGMEVAVFLKSGERFAGIFSAASTDRSEPRVTLKFTRKTLSGANEGANGVKEPSDEYIGEGEDHVTTFNLFDIVDLSVSDLYLAASENRTQHVNTPTFRTDQEISGNLNIRERELQRWQPSADTAVNTSLDDSARPGEWDQFAANEALYNVRSDYDENLYTTAIDRSDPDYRRKEAEAARIAREIERSAPVNSHVAEERRMNADKDAGFDEEDKYSGVRRDITSLVKGAPNAYVPPSRRPITSQPTVSGAPYDPAIISSQISRPSPPAATSSDFQASLAKQQEQKKSQDEGHASKEVEAPNATTVPALPTVTAPSGETSAAATKSTVPSKATPSAAAGRGATEGVERKVLEQFKHFSNTEKLRVQQAQRVIQERNRATAHREKSVKLNDLKKFAENFKLYSRVPDDLVPILAKTKEKQNEIVTKAEQQAREKEQKAKSESTSPVALSTVKPDTASAEANKTQRTSPTSARPDAATEPGSPMNQRQRMSQNVRQIQGLPPRGPGMLSPQGGQPRPPQYRNGLNNMQIPTSIPAPETRSPPTGPAPPRDITSPLSAATRLNVKAMEFRPNPSASTFTPTSPTKPSPQPAKRASISTASPAKFFSRKNEKPLAERTPLGDAFDPIKHMLETTDSEKKTKDFASNGGIPQAYRTGPTWDCTETNRDKSYSDMFAQSPASIMPPMNPTNNAMAHQHQLPPHLQNGPPAMPASQTPRFYPPQPHHPGQHFDEHRMQYASSNPSVQPSPRIPPAMAYGAQIHPQMQHYPAGMTPYNMSPAMGRPLPATQFGGPQGPPMGGQMMVQQPSNGPFMNGPMAQQVPVFASPVPGHVQPHFPGHPAAQPGPGFGRGHPMTHQGSQQGHPGQMYMMPPTGPMMMQQHPGQMGPMRNFPQGQFAGGPQAQHGYPMQHRTMSNQGYNHNQMTPRQHHAAPQQGPSPGMPPIHPVGPGDEGK